MSIDLRPCLKCNARTGLWASGVCPACRTVACKFCKKKIRMGRVGATVCGECRKTRPTDQGSVSTASGPGWMR